MKILFSDRAFQVCCAIFLILSFVVVFYPLWYCVAASFSSTDAVLQGRVVFWPVGFTLTSYQSVITFPLLRSGFFNSLYYVFFGTIVSVSLLLLAAYPLSRKDLPFRRFFQVYFVITMFFSGGIIPNYILMSGLNLIGTRTALIIGFMFSCYNMIIVKSYFQNSIPVSLQDAAHIDGCGDVRFFFSIALPLAIPVIAVMVFFNAVTIWNSYFNGMMYLTKTETFNFQMILRSILFVAERPREMLGGLDPATIDAMLNRLLQMRYAVLVVGALPMMVLYPFIQRFFIRGMMIGSLKE
jgi:multiple sugar transport system permease protein/putative aldouronate transport system permease protein